MQFQAALILEGGANMGVFTVGVLDFFQKHQLYLPYVAAVSVGVCNAMDYALRQPGRTRSCMIPAGRNVPPIHWRNLYRKGSVIDLDLVFGEYPNRLVPFDFAAFQNSETTCDFVVTNCRTGTAEYLSERENKERMLAICRTSCSMPYILPMAPVGEDSYLDGGISDPIPIEHARLRGYEKVIVILTQRKGFLSHGLCCEPYLIRNMYRKYPALSEALESRIERYKNRLSYIEQLEKAGGIYVIRPERVEAKALCMDERRLKRFYMQCYETAETNFAAVMDYLKKFAGLWLTFGTALLGTSVIGDFVKESYSDYTPASALTLALLVIILAGYAYLSQDRKIEPYKRTRNLIGLYSAEGSGAIEADFDNGLIAREEEVIRLIQAVEYAFQAGHGLSVCLTGKSGCGKSTIIHLFEQDERTKSSFRTINYSEHYHFLSDYAGRDGLMEAGGEKIVVILDQFERFFQLPAEQQESAEEVVRDLAGRGVVVLFSLREKYLARFLMRFDPDDLTRCTGTYSGILYERIPLLSQHGTSTFLCIGDDSELPQSAQAAEEGTLKRLCFNALKKEGEVIAGIAKDMTLIQKEIILNMLENEHARSGSVLHFLGRDEQQLMRMYYDTQLCSTGNYLDASRILYLLSVGRLNAFYSSKRNIAEALCLSEDRYEKLDPCLESLCELQLIKRTVLNSNEFFEAVHDYIAQSYTVYANTELQMDVKAGLDEYLTEFRNKKVHKRNWEEELPQP